uniref:Uncharacterized protein n=1 Tax=Arundo donax TaxID=35708 RepID=A0A0A9ENG3_ARUDO
MPASPLSTSPSAPCHLLCWSCARLPHPRPLLLVHNLNRQTLEQSLPSLLPKQCQGVLLSSGLHYRPQILHYKEVVLGRLKIRTFLTKSSGYSMRDVLHILALE